MENPKRKNKKSTLIKGFTVNNAPNLLYVAKYMKMYQKIIKNM